MGEGLGLLSWELEAPADVSGRVVVQDEGEGFHLPTAEGAKQWVDLIDEIWLNRRQE